MTLDTGPFVDVEFFRADHGFFCDQRPSYRPEAARQWWALTLAFLRDDLPVSPA